MKKISIGSNRLGSGNKMSTSLNNYRRSTHDLSYIFRTTMSPGTLVPFMVQVGLPGDTFDIDLNAVVKTHPTIGPLFGSFKVQLDVFNCPVRLYNKYLHNNKLDVGRKISDVKLPLMRVTVPEIDTTSSVPPECQQINPSSLLSYLGLKGIVGNITDGTGITADKNAIPLLAYWDIFKNYYANKSETNAYVILPQIPSLSAASITIDGQPYDIMIGSQDLPTPYVKPDSTAYFVGTNLSDEITLGCNLGIQGTYKFKLKDLSSDVRVSGDKTRVDVVKFDKFISAAYTIDEGAEVGDLEEMPVSLSSFPLANIDTMRDNLLTNPGNANYIITKDTNLAPYDTPLDLIGGTGYKSNSYYEQCGLAVKTYQSDIFNNWINTDWIDGVNGISAVTAVSTAGNSFTIDSLTIAKKVYDMLNRVAISGGSLQDWIEATYDITGAWRAETPKYCGGLSKELLFQEVTSTVEASSEKPLGTLAGKGVMSDKHKGGKIVIKCDEPCFIMGIVSITPRVDYSQGNEFYMHFLSLDDFHKPGLDEIGFQSLITDQMAYWDTSATAGVITKYSAGKQPAWLNYMTNYNKCFGNFADPRSQMFMTLNRRYSIDNTTKRIKDLTTYIDPSKFNYAFANTSISSQNFWVNIGINEEVRRVISAKVIPNL